MRLGEYKKAEKKRETLTGPFSHALQIDGQAEGGRGEIVEQESQELGSDLVSYVGQEKEPQFLERGIHFFEFKLKHYENELGPEFHALHFLTGARLIVRVLLPLPRCDATTGHVYQSRPDSPTGLLHLRGKINVGSPSPATRRCAPRDVA